MTPIDLQAVKMVGRQLGRALSDEQAKALGRALEEVDLTRRLRKAANAGRNTRLKRLTTIRKRSEKLAIALGVDDDARADLDILTPPDALSLDHLTLHLRRLAALTAARIAQLNDADGGADGRARNDAIEDLAAIARLHLGIDASASNPAQRSLFADFVSSAFGLWGARPPGAEVIPIALGVRPAAPP